MQTHHFHPRGFENECVIVVCENDAEVLQLVKADTHREGHLAAATMMTVLHAKDRNKHERYVHGEDGTVTWLTLREYLEKYAPEELGYEY